MKVLCTEQELPTIVNLANGSPTPLKLAVTKLEKVSNVIIVHQVFFICINMNIVLIHFHYFHALCRCLCLDMVVGGEAA